MSRRAVFLIALISLAALGAASAPWTLTGSGLATSVTEHMQDRYGLDFKVAGRSTFALLPTPRVKFEDVTLALPDRTLKADGGFLRGELRILPLVFGRVELSDVTLTDTKVTASYQALRSRDWAAIFKDKGKDNSARRLIVVASSLHWTDLANGSLNDIHLVVSWNGGQEPLNAVGSALWRHERVTLEQASLHPALLASDRLSPVSLSLSATSGNLTFTGEAQGGSDPRLTGEGRIQASSVRDFTRWSGMELPFGSVMQAVSVAGDFSMDRRRLTWPSATVTLGEDKLEGTIGVRFDAERPVIAGTLAADSLDLSEFSQPLAQARTSSGAWSEEVIDLGRATGSDLDLRLSASSAKMGRLHFEDIAASVLVRPGRIEASIGRAEINKGTVKGRLSLVSVGGATEFKSQATFNEIDLDPFLAATGARRWITGQAQGQFVIEGLGRTPLEIVRQAKGRSTVVVKQGDVVGVALDDALRRVEKRPLWTSLTWKGGRTPFDQAQAALTIRDGMGEVVEGHLQAPSLVTHLQGHVSLVDRTVDLKAHVSPASPASKTAPVIGFDLSGGWSSVVVTPDARALIERSGAAKPLFGPDRLLPNEATPLATAQ